MTASVKRLLQPLRHAIRQIHQHGLQQPRRPQLQWDADPQDRADYEKLPPYERGLFTLPLGHHEFLNLNRFNPFKGALDTVDAAWEFVRTGKPLSRRCWSWQANRFP